MSEDKDIEMIKARKLREMKERAAAMERAKKSEPEKKEKPAKEIVISYLYDRGDEVLNAAYSQYPAQTEAIVAKIAELIKSGELKERVSGGELLSLFRSVGLRVRIETSIRIQQDDKLVSFSEKLKQNE
jgi:DNA-binding TFAR19-related protein (PDSD5 family)